MLKIKRRHLCDTVPFSLRVGFQTNVRLKTRREKVLDDIILIQFTGIEGLKS